MIPFDEAVAAMLGEIERLEATRVPLHDALGLVLAEPIRSDVDMPPFDKSAMDGFAVLAADLAQTPATLRIVEDVPAGAVPTRALRPGQCARIMTGAPVPQGADTVVRVEDTEPGPGPDQVVVQEPVPRGKNICWKAEDVARGDVVLWPGHVLRAPEIATLAACGCVDVSVFRRPAVAVLSTGNEIVPIDRVPAAGQIRDANAHYLAARLRRLGIEASLLGIAPDEPQALTDALRQGMAHDALVVSGGVSTGDYDLVPGILKDLGTRLLFDSVAMQPGRPTVFGRCGRTAVFGLPGNPVSVLVASEIFLVPALRAMMGYSEAQSPRHPATLTETARHRPGRLAHVPGVLTETEDGWAVRPLAYHGSAHIHALSRANCLLVLPPEVAVVEAPARVEVIELRV